MLYFFLVSFAEFIQPSRLLSIVVPRTQSFYLYPFTVLIDLVIADTLSLLMKSRLTILNHLPTRPFGCKTDVPNMCKTELLNFLFNFIPWSF